MSFEGYYEALCEDGHLTNIDQFSDLEKGDPCNVCGKPIKYIHVVDQTNGSEDETHLKLTVASPEVRETCPCCGNVSVKEPARYSVELDESGYPVIV